MSIRPRPDGTVTSGSTILGLPPVPQGFAQLRSLRRRSAPLLFCQGLGAFQAGNCDANLAASEFNSVGVERSLHAVVNLLPNRELLAGFGHKLASDDHADIVKVEDPLRFEWL